MSVAASFHVEPRWRAALAAAGLGDYEAVMACQAGRRLDKPNLGARERIRLEFADPEGRPAIVFLKRYGQAGPEAAELQAVRAVRAAGIPTMEALAWGAGPRGGFILVSAVPGQALHDCLEALLRQRGADDETLNGHLARRLGALAAGLHAAGLAHRDLYTTHLFIALDAAGRLELHLIDLGRVFRPRRPRRWRIKDMAQLKFSLPPAWVRRNWPALMAAYHETLGEGLGPLAALRIELKARAMARSYARRMRRMGESA